jgi:hypothetical protein
MSPISSKPDAIESTISNASSRPRAVDVLLQTLRCDRHDYKVCACDRNEQNGNNVSQAIAKQKVRNSHFACLVRLEALDRYRMAVRTPTAKHRAEPARRPQRVLVVVPPDSLR